MKRDGWILLGISFILGIAGGLYYAWNINPVAYVDAAPSSLRQDFQSDYITLIAASYAATGELDRAQVRLSIFSLDDLGSYLGRLAQNRLAEGRPESEARALAMLAAAVGEGPPALPITPSPSESASTGEPSVTSSPSPSNTPSPMRPPTSTPGAPFELIEQEKVCDPSLGGPLLQVRILDALSEGVPRMSILVIWDSGQEKFFTGLKPELGLGFADFAMTEGVIYTLQVSDADRLVTGLTSELCTSEEGELYPGAWLLTFQRP
ncbi:MAG: hypothetical protein ACERKX_04990 [Anaerolineales bacterium]